MLRRSAFLFIFFITVILFTAEKKVNQPDNDIFTSFTELKSPFLDGKLPRYAPNPWKFEQIYTSLEIGSPGVTGIFAVPGKKEYLLLGKEGKVWVFQADRMNPNARLVLDISEKMATISEAGLSGFAFHPHFDDETSSHYREVFMFYTYQPGDSLPLYDRLSKFKFSAKLDSILESSEEILIQQYDRDYNHNAGEIFFGNEGFLYLTLGDEGRWQDWYQNGQKLDKRLFSGIIRIDVDMDFSRSHPIRRYPLENEDKPEGFPDNINQNYLIPDSNPWVDESGKYLEEFYAIGLRNPFSAFYDTLDGRIWLGDVGEGDREEINVISKGSNGQWPYREGTIDGYKSKPETIYGKETPPVYEYSRKDGRSVIGGIIYRGEEFPELYGDYIFGDFDGGNIWSYDSTLQNSVTLLTRGFPRVVDFFIDYDGSLCALSISGGIYKFSKTELIEEAPRFLSELGAFDNLDYMIPSHGIVPYDVNAPLWSDGAVKKRWIALPDTSKITLHEEDPWEFPVGTVFIKHFELFVNKDSIKKLETRFFVIDKDKNGYGITYKWNKEDTEAELVGYTESPEENFEVLSGTDVRTQVWSYPSRGECLECHNQNTQYVLGVKTSQLNRDITFEDMEPQNQILLWRNLGFFKNEQIPAALPELSHISDTSFNLTHRIKSYLDANCSHCHQPGGVNAGFDARFQTPISEQKMILQPINSTNSVHGNNIITPQNLDQSELWIRDASLASNKMPPIAKNILDTAYLNLLKNWILEMDPHVLPLEEMEESLIIYPNPVVEKKFEIFTKEKLQEIYLYDMYGRRVPVSVSFQDSNHKARILLPANLKYGVFGVLCKTNRKVYTEKIIVLE